MRLLQQRFLIQPLAKNFLFSFYRYTNMSIAEIVQSRKIERVLHFTTNRGSLGVLATKALKSRARLNDDALLANIVQFNAPDRSRDAAWHDYVNLSISKINASFFGVSAGKNHKDKDFWWCILDFSPSILSHNGVHFANTNNMYSGVVRAQGPAGLESLFAPEIKQYQSQRQSSMVSRTSSLAPCYPTCSQAEALYPGEVSTDFLQAIYVLADASADELAGQVAAVAHRHVNIEVRPELFQNIK